MATAIPLTFRNELFFMNFPLVFIGIGWTPYLFFVLYNQPARLFAKPQDQNSPLSQR